VQYIEKPLVVTSMAWTEMAEDVEDDEVTVQTTGGAELKVGENDTGDVPDPSAGTPVCMPD
jgi:hypothetical protein